MRLALHRLKLVRIILGTAGSHRLEEESPRGAVPRRLIPRPKHDTWDCHVCRPIDPFSTTPMAPM